ncbi:MAG TPA: hypothetical protein VMZ31_06590 [Phycisphaerae bacterium]|nr:hypothetical protein [Phycisphaerae bacterium]
MIETDGGQREDMVVAQLRAHIRERGGLIGHEAIEQMRFLRQLLHRIRGQMHF